MNKFISLALPLSFKGILFVFFVTAFMVLGVAAGTEVFVKPRIIEEYPCTPVNPEVVSCNNANYTIVMKMSEADLNIYNEQLVKTGKPVPLYLAKQSRFRGDYGVYYRLVMH